MSSGRGRSPCDTGPRELRLDVIYPGTLAAPSRRNDGSESRWPRWPCPRTRGHIDGGHRPEVPVADRANVANRRIQLDLGRRYAHGAPNGRSTPKTRRHHPSPHEAASLPQQQTPPQLTYIARRRVLGAAVGHAAGPAGTRGGPASLPAGLALRVAPASRRSAAERWAVGADRHRVRGRARVGAGRGSARGSPRVRRRLYWHPSCEITGCDGTTPSATSSAVSSGASSLMHRAPRSCLPPAARADGSRRQGPRARIRRLGQRTGEAPPR